MDERLYRDILTLQLEWLEQAIYDLEQFLEELVPCLQKKHKGKIALAHYEQLGLKFEKLQSLYAMRKNLRDRLQNPAFE